MADSLIELHDLKKEFDGTPVLRGISLDIKSREFVTLLGPSGCGKTTTLRIIGGFEQPDSGDVLFEGRRLNDVPPYRREINTVFQRYALFPHLNVAENIAFGLHIKKMNPAEIKLKTREMLSLVGLSGFEARDVTSLSGGQQQRVALARTLNQNPKIILADEPVASLDPITAKQVMEDFVRINKEYNISILLNIHHVDLALKYCDRVIGVRAGEIVFDGPASTITQEQIDAVYNGTKVPTMGDGE